MCDFPSWIEEQNGRILFVTDADLEHFAPEEQYDAVGHDGIRRIFPGTWGNEGEGFPCPPVIAREIRRGTMRRLMRLGSYAAICVSSDGQLHRDDGPAVEMANGDKYWYRNGRLHRDDGPAIETSGGSKYWYRNGRLHRDDGPAIELANGNEYWCRNGKRLKQKSRSAESEVSDV